MIAKNLFTISVLSSLLISAVTLAFAETPNSRPAPRGRSSSSKDSKAAQNNPEFRQQILVRPQVSTTERGYEAYKNDFCNDQNNNNGETIMRELDKANEEAYLEMDRIKTQINSEVAALAILNDTFKAKADYNASLKKLAEGTPAEVATIQSARSAFDTASILFALKTLSESGPEKFDATTLKNRYCPRMNDPKACTEWIFKSMKTKSVEYLATAYEKVKDKESLNRNIAGILQDMPERLAPEVTIALVQDHEELHKKIDPKTSEIMLRCLDDKNKNNLQECRDFFANPKHQDLINSIKNEGQKIQSALDPLLPSIKDGVEKSKNDLERHSAVLQSSFSDSQKEKAEAEKKMQAAIDKCIDYIEKHFSKESSLLASCKMDDVKKATESIANNIKTNVALLNKKGMGDTKFNAAEILKIYAANKYLCQCTGNKKFKWENQTTCYNNDPSSASILYKLDGDVSDVIKKMNFSSHHAYFTDKCASSPDLLLEAKTKCQEFGSSEPYKKICAIVANESAMVVEKKENEKKWEDMNRDYWLKADPSGKGYIRTKKKTTWELVGEGIKPVLPGLVPMWMANYQMKSQINMMTQQALAEKQYYHNIDIYNQNPWMFSYPYFQGNYFQLFGSPFSPTALPPTTTTNTGYNFAP